jgi:hypothetical protein
VIEIVPAVLLPSQQAKLGRGVKDAEHAMPQGPNMTLAVIDIEGGLVQAKKASAMGPPSA